MIYLRKLRERLGINQTELGLVLGVTTPMISFYERGINALPVEAAKRIAKHAASLGETVTYEDIYGPIA